MHNFNLVVQVDLYHASVLKLQRFWRRRIKNVISIGAYVNIFCAIDEKILKGKIISKNRGIYCVYICDNKVFRHYIYSKLTRACNYKLLYVIPPN
jgi:hypothetical protein